jgi:hypothetical protein
MIKLLKDKKKSKVRERLDKKVRRFIEFKLQFPKVHWFPKAEGIFAYLKSPHRHLFHVHVRVEVFEADREIEFLELQRITANYIGSSKWIEPSEDSCEHIAEYIHGFLSGYLGKLSPNGPVRGISVRVLEDNENGAEFQSDL